MWITGDYEDGLVDYVRVGIVRRYAASYEGEDPTYINSRWINYRSMGRWTNI